MGRKLFSTIMAGAVFLAASLCAAEVKTGGETRMIKDVYPDLTLGALSRGLLEELDEGVLFKAEDVEITLESITKIIDSQPQKSREEFRKNAFFILEQEATNQLLLHLARKAVSMPGEGGAADDNTVMQRFFEQEVLKDIEVADEEVREFYEKNKEMFGGATLSQVTPSLKAYILSQKKQQKASEYVRTLGERVSMRVSAGWVKEQAVLSKDNVVDKARRSGKCSLVDFGADGCKPCEMMAPILDTLKKKYKGKLNVVFVHVREHQMLASRFGIQSIPVQVFFDKDGKEVFRHVGFFAQEEIEKKLKEIGVQ